MVALLIGIAVKGIGILAVAGDLDLLLKVEVVLITDIMVLLSFSD